MQNLNACGLEKVLKECVHVSNTDPKMNQNLMENGKPKSGALFRSNYWRCFNELKYKKSKQHVVIGTYMKEVLK